MDTSESDGVTKFSFSSQIFTICLDPKRLFLGGVGGQSSLNYSSGCIFKYLSYSTW